MEIIFQGNHSDDEAIESLSGVIRLFRERYKISQFREMHFTVTLVDVNGDDVELVDAESNQVYRYFEVYRDSEALTATHRKSSALKLVVDNTCKSPLKT